MSESKNLLLIMRHADSCLAAANMSDRERPLSSFGKTQPDIIGRKLNDLKICIDQALVSNAKRTTETYSLLAPNMLNVPQVEFYPELYNATLEDILDTLSEHICEQGTALVLAHCPGVGELVEYLTGHSHSFIPAQMAVLQAREENLVRSVRSPKKFNLVQILDPY